MKKIFTLTYLFLGWGLCLLPLISFGQGHRYFGRVHRCATHEMDSLLRQSYPQMGSTADFERWLSAKMAFTVSRDIQEVYTLPVIVHIVHNGEAIGVGPNISAAQVQSQIDVLNEDFRRELNTPGYNNNPLGADVEIEFCLATIDPDGIPLAEPGIHRINRNDEGWVTLPYSPTYVRNQVMPNSIWDTDKYMNVWTVDLQNDVLGYAQLPSQSTLPDLAPNQGPATSDGVMIDPNHFGRIGNVSAPYDQGRTTTHEVGHWLGLRHIWGDGPCSEDDFCSDTPEAAAPNYGCPTGATACGGPIMVRNYMDYTDDACMNIFTQCQSLRMRTVLENAPRRLALLSSNACQTDLSPVPAFSTSQGTVCEGGQIQFFDESLYQPTSWQWSFPGGSPSTSTAANPVITYFSSGVYSVELTVANSFGTQTLSWPNQVEVVSGALTEVFFEDFENGLGAWQVENPDNDFGWELEPVSGNGGSVAPYVNLYLYASVGQKDGLISPAIDLSNYGNLELSVEYAYRPFSAEERDSLLISASVDNGQSFPFTLYQGAQGSMAFATGPNLTTSFTPSQASDWCGTSNGAGCIEINLSAFIGEPQFKLKVETVNAFGNNIFVDNIRIEGSCQQATEIQDIAVETWHVYPQPATDDLTIEGPQQYTPLGFVLYDLAGRSLRSWRMEGNDGKYMLTVGEFPPGVYVLEIQSEQGIYRQSLKID